MNNKHMAVYCENCGWGGIDCLSWSKCLSCGHGDLMSQDFTIAGIVAKSILIQGLEKDLDTSEEAARSQERFEYQTRQIWVNEYSRHELPHDICVKYADELLAAFDERFK